MKKILFIITFLIPLSLCAQSALYRQYADRPYISVAEISGFRLNDSIKVDVVLLTADNKEEWTNLAKEFDIRFAEGSTSWLSRPDHPKQRVRWTGVPVYRVIASPKRRTIAFYQIENETQYDALIDYQTLHMKNNTQGK